MLQLELVDISETRRRNLLVLIAQAGGRVKDLGEAMRRHLGRESQEAASKDYANTISQYKNGKPMGDGFARVRRASPRRAA